MAIQISSSVTAPTHNRGLGDSTHSDKDSRASVPSHPDPEENGADGKNFKLSRRGVLVFITLAVLILMAALDGTSLSVALPVWTSSPIEKLPANDIADNFTESEWNRHRGLLVRNRFSTVLNR
jgi:hypothetical protein